MPVMPGKLDLFRHRDGRVWLDTVLRKEAMMVIVDGNARFAAARRDNVDNVAVNFMRPTGEKEDFVRLCLLPALFLCVH